MNISYHKLWKFLIDRGLKRSCLQKRAKLSTATLSKLSKNENVNIETLVKICEALDCDFGDIMERTKQQIMQRVYEEQSFHISTSNDTSHPAFKLGELFCGPGGLALGAMQANIGNNGYAIKHEWANDYDEDTCKTYRLNICPNSMDSVICADVRKLNLDKLPTIDALAFGFPCNDFSVVGEQKGFSGSFGPLYSYGVKVLQSHQPKWFLAENVGGLKSANNGTAFSIILNEMKCAGYNVYPHLYKFEDYGVPQARHRIIIVGIRNDLPYAFNIPSPKPYENYDNSCKVALEVPPIESHISNSEITRQSPTVVNRLMHIRPGENAFTADLPEELRLNVKGAKISQIYKRLDPNRPAYTVTGSGGGGTHIYHYKEPRALTNRERARLQTFPDTFIFHGSKESVRKQIGMAVPCRGAKVIFEAILKTFAGVNYESIPSNVKW